MLDTWTLIVPNCGSSDDATIENMSSSWVGLFESFAARRFGGNLAGVIVSDAALDNATMLGLASDLAAPTTGFVSRETVSPADAPVRFFTPTQEIDACGHVTIAVVQALQDLGIWEHDGDTTVTCRGGSFPITRCDGRVVMKQTPRPAPALVVGTEEMSDLLGVTVTSVQTAATGLKHIFAEIADVEELSSVIATHDEIARLGNQSDVDTVGVYARIEHSRVRLRDFTAPIGVLEEPASGTTAGALGTLLGVPILTVEQGVEMGRPSELLVSLDGSNVEVAGVARRVLSGTLD